MQYKRRHIEDKLNAYVDAFSCTLVTGARQVGKSTLIDHLFGERFTTFVFDPIQDIYGVKQDPDLFLRNNPPPLILDEIQYVPELVPALKRYIDGHRKPGMYIITGSQQWHVMRKLSESLAGRIGMLELPAFSCQEMVGEAHSRPCWLNAWMEASPRGIDEALHVLSERRSREHSATEQIWRGSFPEVQTLDQAVIPGWMQGYVNTYLQRDVRALVEARDETQFSSFLALCAALTAQECNYEQFGRDIGLSAPSAKRWSGILRGTYQWLEVPAFSRNHIKRLSSRPKGYLTDTGLAAYLLRLSSPQAVQGHPAFGALFETLIVTECYKQIQQQDLVPVLHHYRQHSGAEVDLILEKDGRLFPVEVKAASSVRPGDARSIHIFQDKLGDEAQPGLIVYGGSRVIKLTEHCAAIPFDLQ
jgi:predicted AAA+ superfamily ATPase